MHKINFNDGLEEIMINNDPERVIKWNPTDSNFSKRYFEFTDYVKNLYEQLQNLSKNMEGIDLANPDENITRTTAEQLSQMGAELSEKLDETFNAPISQIAFRGANPLSPTRSGSFLFDNFLSAISPIVNTSVEEAGKATEKRIRKYTAPVSKASKKKARD